jgi:hypothetical protein
MSSRQWVRYDRWVKCKACGQRVDYNAELGGRPPKYCETCREEVKREQAHARVRAMRRRRGRA